MFSYLSDCVGAGSVGDFSCGRTVGGVGSENLGGINDGAVVVGKSTGHEGSGRSDG